MLAWIFGVGAVLEVLLWLFLIGLLLLAAAVWFGWRKFRQVADGR